jgi:demethoxyubiquinone hydroxylase (CLK1/Coq7/Cat5 family)
LRRPRRRQKKLQPLLPTSREWRPTMLVLLNQRKTTCLVSKVTMNSKAEAEAEEAEEVLRVEQEGEAEASRICK